MWLPQLAVGVFCSRQLAQLSCQVAAAACCIVLPGGSPTATSSALATLRVCDCTSQRHGASSSCHCVDVCIHEC